MLEDPLKMRLDIRDRSIAAGLASRPVSWCTAAALSRFSPTGLADRHGNAIFYGVLRNGWAAEAFVVDAEDKFSRIRIDCGYLPLNRRPYEYIRLATLGPRGWTRLTMIMTSRRQPSVTIGILSPRTPATTHRLLVSRSVDGTACMSARSIVHTDEWVKSIGVNDPEAVRHSNVEALRRLGDVADMGLARFGSLLANLRHRVEIGGLIRERARQQSRRRLAVSQTAACASIVVLTSQYVRDIPPFDNDALPKLGLLAFAMIAAEICREATFNPPWPLPAPPYPPPTTDPDDMQDDPNDMNVNEPADGGVSQNGSDYPSEGGGEEMAGGHDVQGPLPIEMDPYDDGAPEDVG